MVEFGKVLEGAGVGVVDEILQYADAHAAVPRTESFKTWQDWGRIGLFAVGLIGPSFMPRYGKFLDTLAIASSPLAVKTLAVPLKDALGIARRAGAPTWVPTRVPQPARPARPASRSYMPDAGIIPVNW